MKEAEFYKRAATDAAFRKAKLKDLRYFKSVAAGLFWFLVLTMAAFSLYGGFTEGRWLLGDQAVSFAAVTGCFYLLSKTRIAALEALDVLNP